MIQKTKLVWGESASDIFELPGLLDVNVGDVIWLNGEPFGETPWKVMKRSLHVNVCKENPEQVLVLFIK